MSQVLEEQGPVSQQLIAATVIPAMSTARGPRRRRFRLRRPRERDVPPQLLVQFVVLPRIIGSGRDACTARRPASANAASRAPRLAREPRPASQFDDNVVTCFLDGAATLLAARKQGLLKRVRGVPSRARRRGRRGRARRAKGLASPR